MIRDFRLNTLFKNIVNKLTNNKHSSYEDWINKYNKLSDNFKENLIISIYNFQIKDIRNNCKNKEDSYLINLGVFKIKSTRNIALSIKADLIKECGCNNWGELSDSEKLEIVQKTELKKREKLIEYNNAKEVIKEGNRTKVLYLSELKPKKL